MQTLESQKVKWTSNEHIHNQNSVSPMIWRRLSIPGNTSLAQLHQIIQISNQWDDEFLHQFHIYGKDYGIRYIGGVSFSDDAYQVFLDDFMFDVRAKFTYKYNFFEHWSEGHTYVDGVLCWKVRDFP